MKLVTIDRPPAGRTGAIIGDEILDLGMASRIVPVAAWIPPLMRDLLEADTDGLDICRRVIGGVEAASNAKKSDLREIGALTPYAQTRLRAPTNPFLIFSHGGGYASHNREMQGRDRPDPVPAGYVKGNGAVIGTGAPIILPREIPGVEDWKSDKVDWEGEVSLVFGRTCHNVSAAEIMDYIVGWTIMNDGSPRVFMNDVKEGRGFTRICNAKQLPSMAPLGPCIATMDEFPDPLDIHMQTRVNGVVMQDCRTSEMVFPIPVILEEFARWYTFQPGDIVTCGTPAGCGYNRDPQVFLKPGDVVAISVDGLGVLENPVVAAQ